MLFCDYPKHDNKGDDMPLPTDREKIIIDIIHELPPDKLDEVIDFAEYLKKKNAAKRPEHVNIARELPVFHLGRIEQNVFDRAQLYGEHLDRKLA
jgi:hypothetical protein